MVFGVISATGQGFLVPVKCHIAAAINKDILRTRVIFLMKEMGLSSAATKITLVFLKTAKIIKDYMIWESIDVL